MKKIKNVLFEPYNDRFAKVTATFEDNSSLVVFLDNNSAKAFMQLALTEGTVGV